MGSRLLGTRPEFLDFPENPYGKEQLPFSGEGRRVPKKSLALGQLLDRTSASLELLQSKRHFRDSPALARKDYLLLPLSIFGEIQEFGPCAIGPSPLARPNLLSTCAT